MTSQPFLRRHGRTLLLGAATVMLHYITIDWLAARIGMADEHREAPPTVSAQLRLALPQRVETVQRQAPVAPLPPPPDRPLPSRSPPRRRKAWWTMPGRLPGKAARRTTQPRYNRPSRHR
ncbi:hypothetical protein [Pseudoduganella chitinolytica]|uniref:DUF3108 domain-containing protein n=1 Tax=Pseudoduganella chitinolytica TaxID=34070 RepID=A0ABY8B9N7_9BURK|nr:hypothetical protein [Pseudoduganella chitinolytica]WEF32640.1 hypothetical protein PX653_25045 [Pseudoduganella chitinolytica]